MTHLRKMFSYSKNCLSWCYMYSMAIVWRSQFESSSVATLQSMILLGPVAWTASDSQLYLHGVTNNEHLSKPTAFQCRRQDGSSRRANSARGRQRSSALSRCLRVYGLRLGVAKKDFFRKGGTGSPVRHRRPEGVR